MPNFQPWVHLCPKCYENCIESEGGMSLVCGNKFCDYKISLYGLGIKRRGLKMDTPIGRVCPHCAVEMERNPKSGNYHCNICHTSVNKAFFEDTVDEYNARQITILRASWLMWVALLCTFSVNIFFCAAVITKIHALEKQVGDLPMLQRTVGRHSQDIENLARDSASLENRLPMYREAIRNQADLIAGLRKDVEKLKER